MVGADSIQPVDTQFGKFAAHQLTVRYDRDRWRSVFFCALCHESESAWNMKVDFFCDIYIEVSDVLRKPEFFSDHSQFGTEQIEDFSKSATDSVESVAGRTSSSEEWRVQRSFCVVQ